MKLYYTPGACSLSPHIALRESGLSFDLQQVDLKAKKLKDGGDFLAVNPKGYVPALALDSGEVLTEGAIIVQYIADKVPSSRLAPQAGTLERLRLQEWLHFIATELHKGFGPINHPKSTDDVKQAFRERLEARFAILAKGVEGKSFLLGDTFTVADGYAYYTLRNLRRLDEQALERSPGLKSYFERVGERPAVKAALAAEGLS
ncbi:glutathione transferase GstA [Sorangium sp. So ce1389]|uniref:glutathione transferase GstA n=1 Tax=Sorangium sp. So ce1389 TaxID=3133336 RepID=UPI003F641A5F